MRLKSILATAASFALVAAPTVASANPAASLSVGSSVRASAPAGESKLSAPGGVIGLVLFAAIIAGGVYVALDDDDSDSG